MSGARDSDRIVHLAVRPIHRPRVLPQSSEGGSNIANSEASLPESVDLALSSPKYDIGMTETHSKNRTTNTGLLLVREVLKTPDDFGGNEVKPRSLIASSDLTFMHSPFPGIPAGPAVTGTPEWYDLRTGYLVEKEEQLRSLHTEASKDLLTILDVIEEKSNLAAERGPHALYSLVQQMQRLFAALNRTILPLQAIRAPTGFLHDIIPPPDRDDHTFDEELLAPWTQQAKEILRKTQTMLRKRAEYFADLVKDLIEEAQSGHDSEGDEARKNWIENKHSNVFVRKADPRACSSLLDSIQFAKDALYGTGMFDYSPVVVNGSGEGAVAGGAVISRSRMLMPDSWAIVCRTPLFKGSVDGAELMHEIASKLRPMLFAPNALVIKKGTVGRAMYFINSGSCKVSVEGKTVAHRRAGEFLGEIALIVSEERMADVETEGPAELFELRRSEFHEIICKYPHIYKRLAAVATVRVWNTGMETSLDEEGKGKMVREEDLRACDMDEVCNFNNGPNAHNMKDQANSNSTPSSPTHIPQKNLEEGHYASGSGIKSIHSDCLDQLKESLLKDHNEPHHLVQWSQIIQNITNSSRRVEHPPNREIFRVGECGKYLYIVEKGSCGEVGAARVMRPGGVFGVGALLASCTRQETVCAGEEGAVVLQMHRQHIVHLLEEVSLFEDMLQDLIST